MDIPIVCSLPAMVVIYSHLPHCLLPVQFPPCSVVFCLIHVSPFSPFSKNVSSSLGCLLWSSSTFSSVSSLCSTIYLLTLPISSSVTPHSCYHIPSFPDFLAFSMPSSPSCHLLVHLSVSCLSLQICLFTPSLSPYSCMLSMNTHILKPHLYLCIPSSFVFHYCYLPSFLQYSSSRSPSVSFHFSLWTCLLTCFEKTSWENKSYEVHLTIYLLT